MRRLTLALSLLLALAACSGDVPTAPSTSLKPAGASTWETTSDSVYLSSDSTAENDSTASTPSTESPPEGSGIMIGGGN